MTEPSPQATAPRPKPVTSPAAAALRLASLSLPHLSGLAAAVELVVDPRIETAGVFASGRIVVNPNFLAELDRSGAAFVLAHELMHLALDSHQRAAGSDPMAFNYAHDYIINDMLVEEMGRAVPGGGLYQPGARQLSVEKILAQIYREGRRGAGQCWSRGGGLTKPQSDLGKELQDALTRAGIPFEPFDHPEDVLSDELERQWFPEVTPQQQQLRRQAIRAAAAKAASLKVLADRFDKLQTKQAQLLAPEERPSALEVALQRCYRPPWEMALQRWLETIAPGPRTFARPSRRAGDREDVVLPGRRREGWTLHIVLDTSGSMEETFPVALGAIAAFSESVGIAQVHILQCDVDVTADEFVDIEKLSRFRIAGLGGSDMSPAMRRLARDTQVEAAVVLTDGYIYIPEERMPYEVLWVVINGSESFSPEYGHVLRLGIAPT